MLNSRGCCSVAVGLCDHFVALPLVADGEDGLNIWGGGGGEFNVSFKCYSYEISKTRILTGQNPSFQVLEIDTCN